MDATKIEEFNLKQFSNQKYFDECVNLSHDEIIRKYGDYPLPVGELNKNDPLLKGLWSDAEDNKVYTGLGSFIDHWVNHPEMEAEDFLKIGDVLKNPADRYYDEIKNAVIFVKDLKTSFDIVVLKKAKDKIIYERSNYLPTKLPKRWEKISRETGFPLSKKMSFADGHPAISHSEKSEAGIVRNISTLNDNLNISQKQKKSTKSKADDFGRGR